MSLDPETPRSVARSTVMVWATARNRLLASRRPWLGSLALLVSCRPVVQPEAPGEAPTSSTVVRRSTPPPDRQALLGEMCPDAIAGRPGLSPLAVRTISWSSDPDEMMSPIERGSASPFTVLGFDGRRAGTFSAIASAEPEGGDVAMGAYAGAPPCSRRVGTDVAIDPGCEAAQRGCGLALAVIGASGSMFDMTDAPTVDAGGACLSGDTLAIDIDADGAPEMFPLASFVAPTREPEKEVSAVPQVAPSCKPSFSLHGLMPTMAPGPTLEDRHRVKLDLLGVLDLDRDGRYEVVVAYRYAEIRTIAVYSAIDSPARLERVGETER